jgi:hypothetical protein
MNKKYWVLSYLSAGFLLAVTIGCTSTTTLPALSTSKTTPATATPTHSVSTATPVITNTFTATWMNTFTATSTATMTKTNTPTFTVTNTATITNTPTITNTVAFTSTFTPAATATPIHNQVWSTFDSSPWAGGPVPYTPPWPYTSNSIVGSGGSSVTVDVNSEPAAGTAGSSSPYGLEYHGTYVAGDLISTSTEYGPAPSSGCNATNAIWVPNNEVLSIMVYASQPTTVVNVNMLDVTGDQIQIRLYNGVVPAGKWTNLIMQIGMNVTTSSVNSPWMQVSGVGFKLANVVVIGLDYKTVPGPYDFFLDNMYFLSW